MPQVPGTEDHLLVLHHELIVQIELHRLSSAFTSSTLPRALMSSRLSSPTRMWKTSCRITGPSSNCSVTKCAVQPDTAHALLIRLFVGVPARMVGQQRRMNVDDPTAVLLHHRRRHDLHVPRQHHEIGAKLLQLLQQKPFMRRLVGRGKRKERQVVGFGQRPQQIVIGQHRDQLAVEDALLAVHQQTFQAVRFTANQHGHALGLLPSMEANADLHVDLLADALQAEDQLVQVDAELAEVDEHGHDEKAFHDPLLDVFDVDVAARQIGGDARHHPFLVVADDRDNGQILRHGCHSVAPGTLRAFPRRVNRRIRRAMALPQLRNRETNYRKLASIDRQP